MIWVIFQNDVYFKSVVLEAMSHDNLQHDQYRSDKKYISDSNAYDDYSIDQTMLSTSRAMLYWFFIRYRISRDIKY